ncbi:alpha-amylase family glycosyl hydrolase [Nonlabens marinus]|uniref:Periplasmic alpha-amylase n=1 Tax=Nonlabens marinus S1-08 TaxID=1454201 RepID=W8W0A0_9FLAO|nr:alpha-amylase family glycosyl hydrolase [Nonlabens marinus]BAO55961.1 periplasmic alpha-amylase [Nonlabens marinus S1-08]
MIRIVLFACLALVVVSCNNNNESISQVEVPIASTFDWNAANVYFLLTDRFNNGDLTNDNLVPRNEKTDKLRGFEGGDFKGIQQKIEQDYFTDLGINAIWLTPIFEQIEGGVDEGSGFTYAYHGYWAKDWTAVEPSYGTLEEFKELVQAAHRKDIRILLDVVINHTGPVTATDPLWPEDWVRTGPTCTYRDQETAMTCTLTSNLPDIRTDSNIEVELPDLLVNKWKEEGRYEQEVKELETFFEKSQLPRTPVNYIIKWVTDYARETGIDGFRIDTVKHVEESVWTTFIEQSRKAYNQWKSNNPELMIHDDEFFILGELYGYYAAGGRNYAFNESQVDYFDSGYDAMINFGFKEDARKVYSTLFADYNRIRIKLNEEKEGSPVTFMNYISSHDDGQPFDPLRENPIDAGSKLLLTPGISQVYYGDETARKLQADGVQGDANLRTKMNWDEIDQMVLAHWQKLGQFRRNHPAVGAGRAIPLEYTGPGSLSARFYNKNGVVDDVIIGAGLPDSDITIDITKVFKTQKQLRNAYTGDLLTIKNGKVTTQVTEGLVLLEIVDE